MKNVKEQEGGGALCTIIHEIPKPLGLLLKQIISAFTCYEIVLNFSMQNPEIDSCKDGNKHPCTLKGRKLL